MTNLELVKEKLEAARLILGAVEAYQETIDRLLAESAKIRIEVERLLVLEGWDGTNIETGGQGQRVTPQSSDAPTSLPCHDQGDAG